MYVVYVTEVGSLMDQETLLRVLRGEATQFEKRRVKVWRTEAPEHELAYRQLAEAWENAPPFPNTLPGPPPATKLRLMADRRRRRARVVKWTFRAASIAAVLAVVVGIAWYVRRAAVHTGETEFAAGPRDAATVTLMDGSFVRLAPSSSVFVDATGALRQVRLEGRAFFAIAEDADRPFKVRTSAGDITVLGTRFEVSSNGSDLRLVVVNGRVALANTAGQVRVGANEVADVLNGGTPIVTVVADPLSVLDWPDGLLVFQATPLEQVTLEIGRHFGRSIEVGNPSLTGLTVTAVFEDQSFQEVSAAVCLIVGAECTVQDAIVRMR